MKYNKFNAYKFDSKWEEALNTGIMKDFEYHPIALEYTKPETKHKYHPDWVFSQYVTGMNGLNIELKIYIEAKGRFRSIEEMKKYIHIQDGLLYEEELVFLFQKPNLPIFGAKARKDGTKKSHAEWAEDHNFRWFDESTIRTLLNEN